MNPDAVWTLKSNTTSVQEYATRCLKSTGAPTALLEMTLQTLATDPRARPNSSEVLHVKYFRTLTMLNV
jgi:hypothetical protein